MCIRDRLRLAAVLLVRADVLLLDEPTNDLDVAGLELLEAHVTASPAGMVLVSHDREFLARTVTAVADLDEFSHQLRVFHGGWDAYLEERDAADRHARESYERYAATRDALAERARQAREWARTGERRVARSGETDKHIKHHHRQTAQYGAGKASAAERALDRLTEVCRLPSAGRGSQVVFTLRQAVIRRGDVTLGPVNLTIGAGERWRITGPNGTGKSTLLGALLGRVPLVSGERAVGANVVVSEVDQLRAAFATDRPVLAVVAEAAGLSEEDTRTLLAKFRVDADAVVRPARTLSPGERTRAGLALLQARGTTCLVLDEPTNHLDLPAIQQLEQALTDYPGTVLLVTHDRRFAQAVRVDHELDVREL